MYRSHPNPRSRLRFTASDLLPIPDSGFLAIPDASGTWSVSITESMLWRPDARPLRPGRARRSSRDEPLDLEVSGMRTPPRRRPRRRARGERDMDASGPRAKVRGARAADRLARRPAPARSEELELLDAVEPTLRAAGTWPLPAPEPAPEPAQGRAGRAPRRAARALMALRRPLLRPIRRPLWRPRPGLEVCVYLLPVLVALLATLQFV